MNSDSSSSASAQLAGVPDAPGVSNAPGAPDPAMYYQINSSRVTFQEYMFGTKNPLALTLGGVLKLLRVQIPGSSDDPSVASLMPFETTEPPRLPPAQQGKFDEMCARLVALGFHAPIYHVVKDIVHATTHYLASYIGLDGVTVGRAHCRVWDVRHPPRVQMFCEFFTQYEDGSFIWSSSAKPDFLAPPTWEMSRRRGVEVDDLWRTHSERVAGRMSPPPVVLDDEDSLRERVEQHHQGVTQFHLARGVFRPLKPAEVARLASVAELRRKTEALGLAATEHAAILAELERMQTRRMGWVRSLALVIVSCLAFIGASSREWSWDLLLLVPVLAFHELGHFLAMKAFRYQDVRMFFIPFFGAAVSGKNYRAPGWKKAIVALAGPVPGIALATVLGMAGALMHHPRMIDLAILALILNGLNLLPFLPLDGGRVVQSLIFCRHYILDAIFRIIAGGALAVSGFLLHDKLLMYIGVFLIVGLFNSFKLGRIVQQFKREGLPGELPPPLPPGAPAAYPAQSFLVNPAPAIQPILDYDTTVAPPAAAVPIEAALAIIPRVKAAFPRSTPVKVIAQRVANVYEAVNARPPGWLGTLSLGAVHLVSLIAAILLAVTFTVMKNPGALAAFAQQRAPKYSLVTANMAAFPADPATFDQLSRDRAVAVVRLAEAAEKSQPAAVDTSSAADDEVDPEAADSEEAIRPRVNAVAPTAIATYHTAAAASAAFESITHHAPTSEAVELIGQTVLVAIPPGDNAARKKTLADLRNLGSSEVALMGASSWASAQLWCDAPTAVVAKDLNDRIDSYFKYTFVGGSLIPPWLPGDTRSAEQIQQHELARQTYHKLQLCGTNVYSNAKHKDLNKQAARARIEGDQTEADRLRGEMNKLHEQAEQNDIAALRALGPGGGDAEVIDLFVKTRAKPRPKGKQLTALHEQIADRMGALPRVGTAPDPVADRFSGHGFGSTTKQRTIRLTYLQFHDPFDGMPALINWLQSQGCTNFRYEFELPTAPDAPESPN